jgi:hypothetical protein
MFNMNRSVLPAPAVGLLAVVIVSACSGLTSSSDFDPARLDTMQTYQTWDWAYAKDGSVGDLRSSDRLIDDPLLDKQIRGMVESSLLNKGYHRVDGGTPDFRVGYHVSINGRMDVSYINTYYGYGWGGYWGPYGPSFGYVQTTPSVQEYREGTLIIDIVDGPANELAWRGVVQGEVHEKRAADERRDALAKAIDTALKDFPPG